MRHARAQELLSAYLERDLGEAEHAALEAHAAGCDACGADLEDLREAVALLRRLPAPEPPPFLAGRVMARIRDGEAWPSRWRGWLANLAAPAAAATLAAAVAAVAVVQLAEPRRADPVASANQDAGKRLERESRVVGPLDSPRVPTPPRAPQVLARSLRGAGHPHSTSLAAHFERPAEAVVVSWQPQ